MFVDMISDLWDSVEGKVGRACIKRTSMEKQDFHIRPVVIIASISNAHKVFIFFIGNEMERY